MLQKPSKILLILFWHFNASTFLSTQVIARFFLQMYIYEALSNTNHVQIYIQYNCNCLMLRFALKLLFISISFCSLRNSILLYSLFFLHTIKKIYLEKITQEKYRIKNVFIAGLMWFFASFIAIEVFSLMHWNLDNLKVLVTKAI